jgi:hypothetical protein
MYIKICHYFDTFLQSEPHIPKNFKKSFIRSSCFYKYFPAVLWIRIRIGSGFNGVPGPGSRRAKMTDKIRKKVINFMFWSAGCSLLRTEGFSCSLDVLYGGLGISKLQFFYQKNKEKKLCCCIFVQFVVIKTLDTDPQHCFTDNCVHSKGGYILYLWDLLPLGRRISMFVDHHSSSI